MCPGYGFDTSFILWCFAITISPLRKLYPYHMLKLSTISA